ncbi:MAG: hypothetical protein WC421_10085 [Elusimicrobiales bacterium]
MKSMKIVSVLNLLLIFAVVKVHADGCMIASKGMDFPVETDQYAYINYEKNNEQLMVSIGAAKDFTKGVWLLPVPAVPEKVKLDIVENIPDFLGQEIHEALNYRLERTKDLVLGSQLYPLILTRLNSILPYKVFGSAAGSLGSLGSKNAPAGVMVHQQVEKNGIVTELVTAREGDGLYNYFSGKGLPINRGFIPVLDEYTGKDYSFVVSWVDKNGENLPVTAMDVLMYLNRQRASSGDLVKLRRRYADTLWRSRKLSDQDNAALLAEVAKIPGLVDNVRKQMWQTRSPRLAVSVTFPTDKLYYPLKLTSVYGSAVVPATIKIRGFVTPDVFKDIGPYIKTQYFIADDYRFEYAKPIPHKQGMYTKINLSAPGTSLTDDLWIEDKMPGNLRIPLFIFEHIMFSSWLALIALLLVSGISARLIVPNHGLRKNWFAESLALGVAGCFSLVAVAATALFLYKEDTEKGLELQNALASRGYQWKRRWGLLLSCASPVTLLSGLALAPFIILLLMSFRFPLSWLRLLMSIACIAICGSALAWIKYRGYRPLTAILFGAIFPATLVYYDAALFNAQNFMNDTYITSFDIQPMLFLKLFCGSFVFLYFLEFTARKTNAADKLKHTVVSLLVGIFTNIALAAGTIIVFSYMAFCFNEYQSIHVIAVYFLASLVLGLYLPMRLLTYRRPEDEELFKQLEQEGYSPITLLKRTNWLKAVGVFTLTFMLLAFGAWKLLRVII